MPHAQTRGRSSPCPDDEEAGTGSRRAPPAGPAPAPRPEAPLRAHRKPGSAPLPQQTMTEGGQPGGRGTAAARPPCPVSAAGTGVTAARGRSRPAPLTHRTAPAPSPSATPGGPGAGGGGRASAGSPRGLRDPSAPGAAAPAGGAAGSPAVSLGRSCQKARPSRAGPGRGSPGGQAGRGRGPSPAVGAAAPAAPHLRVGPTQAVSVLSISCRIRSCSGRLSAILDGRDPAVAPLREARGRDRGRRPQQSRAGGSGSRRGGLPGAGRAGGPGGGEVGGEGAGEEEQVAPGRAPPVRLSSPGRGAPGAAREPSQAPPSLGHLWALLSGRDRRQSPLPGATRSAPRERRGTPRARPLSRRRYRRTSYPSRAPLHRAAEAP